MTRVGVVFTGGTISMKEDPKAGGNVPALDGAAILARTPGLDAIADIEVVDRGWTPSSHFTFADVFGIAGSIRELLAKPDIDGCVVVQGTDVIEETAFFWDLVVGGEKPVVVTGSMHTASDDGYDGPANMRDAVTLAASPDARDRGVLVVMSGGIGAADSIVKVHSSGLDAFEPMERGPIADTTLAPRGRARRHVEATRAAERIHLITAHIGMDGSLVDAALAAGPVDGFVIAATGSGNTTPLLLDACRRAMDAGVPVVVASRCAFGGFIPAYAFPSGGVTWIRAGALAAGTLSAPKARIALALGIGAGLDREGLSNLLGGPPP